MFAWVQKCAKSKSEVVPFGRGCSVLFSSVFRFTDWVCAKRQDCRRLGFFLCPRWCFYSYTQRKPHQVGKKLTDGSALLVVPALVFLSIVVVLPVPLCAVFSLRGSLYSPQKPRGFEVAGEFLWSRPRPCAASGMGQPLFLLME